MKRHVLLLKYYMCKILFIILLLFSNFIKKLKNNRSITGIKKLKRVTYFEMMLETID